MFEQLKQMAMQQMAQKMMSNSLNEAATGEAAQEGASSFMSMIQEKVAGGNMGEVKDLFSGSANVENNGLMGNLQSKMSEILQSKGMSAEEAQTEAANTTPDLINSLKDKFASTDEADAGFDLGNLTNMIPGNAGDLLNKAKNFFQ